MKTQIYILIFSVIFFAACGNDDDGGNTPVPATKTQLLTSAPWIGTAATIDPPVDFGGTLITDLFAQNEQCNRDDILNFKSDKTYTFEEGVSKCDDNDPQVFDTGTWTFNSDETVVTITSDGAGSEVMNATIISITATQMVTETIEDFGGSVNYTITSTYVHP